MEIGDIIIMDEPATNLHVKGVEELRDFLSDYAKRNKLIFVISTHSPFFIDIDYLENVRVVQRDGNESIISNKFHVLDCNEINSLDRIRNALTVGRHVMLDPAKKTIFVEGITDYCFLTAFKKYFNHNDLVFLPISGLNDDNNGKKLKSDKDLFDAMLRMEKSPTLLVDKDGAGDVAKKRVEEKYKGIVEVIQLSEIDSEFKQIEDLFDAKDRVEKNFDDAVTFKNKLSAKKVSTKTIANFKKFFDNISA